VPTALERAGDFSQSVDNSATPFPYIRDTRPGCHATRPIRAGASPTVGPRQDPANRLYALGLNILKDLPGTERQLRFRPELAEAPYRTMSRVGEDMIRVDYH